MAAHGGEIFSLHNIIKSQLRNILKEVSGSDQFASFHHTRKPLDPHLYLNDHGPISLPLSRSDARTIISKSQESPFGKGSETLIDKSVRKSWQLDPSQFSLLNSQWQGWISEVLSQVRGELCLDCPDDQISADLYKLLLYEEGAFFKPHKDSEKAPGMFGTLVICLPSMHTGGDIILTHNDTTKRFTTSPYSSSGLSYAAWYSDVTHEVTPVVSGFRLVLTYNLINHNTSPRHVQNPTSDLPERLSAALRVFDASVQEAPAGTPRYLVHQLEHQYTQASLLSCRLKGTDVGQVQHFREVADKLGYKLFLASMEKEVVIDEEEEYFRQSRHYMEEDDDDDDDDDSDDEDEDEDEHDDRGDLWDPLVQSSINPVEISRDICLTYIVDLDGSRVDDPTPSSHHLEVQENSIVNLDIYNSKEPDEEEHSGFTGNEGVTATYWYRDTVLLIVPPSTCIEFLYKIDTRCSKLLPWLRELRHRAKVDSAAKSSLEQLCQAIVLSPRWQLQTRYPRGRYGDSEAFSREFMQETPLAALMCDRLDLFDMILRQDSEPMLPEAFYYLGGLITRSSDCPLSRNRVESALKLSSDLSLKLSSIRMLELGTRHAIVADGENSAWVFPWAEQLLDNAVVESSKSGTMNKDDGTNLACVIETWSAEAIRQRIVPYLDDFDDVFTAALVNHLMRDGGCEHQDNRATQNLSNTDRIVLSKQALTGRWRAGCFDFQGETAVTKTANQLNFHPHRGKGPEIDATDYLKTHLSGAELSKLIRTSLRLGVVTEEQVQFHLETAAGLACGSACEYTFLPLIMLILEQKIDMYKLDAETGEPTARGIRLATRILQRYIEVCVGQKPVSNDWTQHVQGCGSAACGDCARVVAFLRSPTEIVGRFPLNKQRRHHLHIVFNDRIHVGYSIETERHTNPNTWVVTKNRSQYQKSLSEWNLKHGEAERRLHELEMTRSLRKYLAGSAEAIFTLDVDKIAAERVRNNALPGPRPLADCNVNIQVPSSSSRTKRAASIDGGGNSKRVRPSAISSNFIETKNGYVEIVDLT